MPNLRQKINDRLDTLESELKTNAHLTDAETVTNQIQSIAKFWSILSGTERDFIHAARYAVENNIVWKG